MDSQTTQRTALTELQTWLRSNACYPDLENAAKSVFAWARKARLPDNVLLTGDGNESKQLQAVTAFVWDVLNDPSRLENCRSQLADFLAEGDMKGFRSVLISRIINHCKDEHRKEQNSPFHYFYRRMSSALSQAEGIQYDSSDGRAYYAISEAIDLKRLIEDYFSVDDFKGWPHPGFTKRDIVKAAVQLGIGRVFWDFATVELKNVSKGEHLLPVKDLVSYVDRMYGLSSLITSDTIAISDDGDELRSTTESIAGRNLHDPFNTHLKQQPTAERNIRQQELAADAIRLVASWKPKTRICFYLLFNKDMSLREISERVGLGSAQAVDHHKDKALKSVEEYFSQWALTGPIDGDLEEDRMLFLEAISDYILKNHPECRVEG